MVERQPRLGGAGTISSNDFAKFFNKWIHCWELAIEKEGDFVEK